MLCALFEAATNSSIDIPISTCLTRECRGSTDPVLSQVFDCDNYYVGLTAAPSCAQRMMSLRAKQPDAPGFVTQLQGGWFALVGNRLSKAMPLAPAPWPHRHTLAPVRSIPTHPSSSVRFSCPQFAQPARTSVVRAFVKAGVGS
jgi:hypothetical protein